MNNRIKEIMERENLTSQRFAQKIGIQPSAVSHILSERNKPSLDVVLKILNTFKYVDPDWLILGTGQMFRKNEESSVNQRIEFKTPSSKPLMASLFADELPHDTKYIKEKPSNLQQPEKIITPEPMLTNQKQESKTTSEKRVVKRIIIYYSDNTFEEYNVCN